MKIKPLKFNKSLFSPSIFVTTIQGNMRLSPNENSSEWSSFIYRKGEYHISRSARTLEKLKTAITERHEEVLKQWLENTE